MPPNEDQLPKADPKQVWQQGQEKWHVDAPSRSWATRCWRPRPFWIKNGR